MDVDVLNHTENPERTVCAAARGDEMEMSMVGVDLDNEDDYARVMESVPYEQEDLPEEPWVLEQDGCSGDVGPVNQAKTRALIHRLIRTYGHYGPFEHTNITFAAEGVSIVVERQITRHRHVTWDVQSLRYVELEDSDVVTPESMQDMDTQDVVGQPDVYYESQAKQAHNHYKTLVNAGVPKEDARYILPLGTPINMTFTMNLRTLMHVVDMRASANCQPETIKFAEKLLEAAKKVAPSRRTVSTLRDGVRIVHEV